MNPIKRITTFVLFFVLLTSLSYSNVCFAATTPSLGAAGTYGILAGTYTNPAVGTTINGDVGFATGPAVAPAGVHTNYGSGSLYTTAGIDQAKALTALNAQPCNYTWPGAIELSADVAHGPIGVYTPGVYCSGGAMSLTTSIKLKGEGTYVFRAVGALGTAAASSVSLADGASANDVYWTATGAVGFGAAASFVGTIISDAGITFGAATTLNGRALSFNGTVTNGAANLITVPGPSEEKEITSFSLGITGEEDEIDSGKINITVPINTPITSLTPTIVVSPKSSVSPASGVVKDFTNPVTYTVTAEDKSIQTYIVTVTPTVTPPFQFLGAATSYGVLANTYTNPTTGTTVNGDIGFITGPTVKPTGTQKNYGSSSPYAKAGLAQAKAQAALKAMPCTYTWPGAIELSADVAHGPIGVYTPGVYCSGGAMSLTTSIKLKGEGTYVFRAVGALGTAAASSVSLADGASANDVYWTATGAVGFGAAASFVGTIISDAGITFGAATTLNGRALSFNGTVTNGAANLIEVPAETPVIVPGSVRVMIGVVNDNGGVKKNTDFPIFINGVNIVASMVNVLPAPATYTVTGIKDSLYTQRFSGDCDASGNINLQPGDEKSCAITYDDIAPIIPPASIYVVKAVINDDGGVKQTTDFSAFINGQIVTSSIANVFPAPATYAITGTTDSKYTQTFSGDCDVSGNLILQPGEDKFCIVTYDDIAPVIPPATITVTEVVINNDGGKKTAAEFPLFVNGGAVNSGQTNVYPAPATYRIMSYAISGVNDYSYVQTFSGDCSSSGQLDLSPNDAKICIITYDDNAPIIPPASLNVSDVVINDNGGTKNPDDFSLFVNGVSFTSGTVEILPAPATYAVTGTTDSKYIQTFSGDCDAGGHVSLVPSDVKFCVVTYNDIAPVIPPATINATAVVVNNNGGTKTVADFPLTINGASVVSNTTNIYPAPASYTITGATNADYIQTYSGDCDATGKINLVAGDNKVCLITYNDIVKEIVPVVLKGTINVTAVVFNNNNGKKTIADFPLTINGVAVVSNITNIYPARLTYTVAGKQDAQYIQTLSGDCDATGKINLAAGDNKVCVITYNDIAPVIPPATINATAVVVNNNGGTKTVADFPLTINEVAVVSNTTNIYPAPLTYTVAGKQDAQYIQTLSGDCDATGKINLAADDNKICLITYNDISPIIQPSSLTVSAIVINDNNGTKTAANFSLFINGASVIPGAVNILPAATTHIVSGTVDTGYVQTFTGDCNSDGHISLTAGNNKSCVVVYNDILPAEVVNHGGSGSDGSSDSGSSSPVPPLVDIVKLLKPISLPSGPVTYDYTLRNIGTVPVSAITMVDDSCSPMVLSSGDLNSNLKLDVNEYWKYTCSTILTKNHTSTVFASGQANGLRATDISIATIVIAKPAKPLVIASINITKVPSTPLLLNGGGLVTYTGKVTNPGTIALTNVKVIDNQCDPVKYMSGDINRDLKLNPGETWTYTCQANVFKTTLSTTISSGVANGSAVRDFAFATVAVTGALSQPIKTIKNDYWLGRTGKEVKIIQQFLIAQNSGPAAKALGKTGGTYYFGYLTRAALAEFQAKVGIKPAWGYFGIATRNYINKNY